ncbi:LptF/LptG family permease [Pelagibacteraceae bacterium]|nr:LptF/LptG family permease [Pelagibacteraceae bacterium]
MVKHKIFKYFFLEFVKLFLLISLSLSILIWMTQAARLLELITEFGNPVSIYVKYIFLIYPKVYENIFLLCFAISIFFLVSKFEDSNELNIYWLSGISKDSIINFLIKIGILMIAVYIFISAFITPWTLGKSRMVLAQSKFSLINSLVKENNFNSPLSGLTIYVNKNDNKGNLENVFIYEKTRTIIAKTGEVLSNNKGSYLKLYNGITHEKNNENINVINFESTIFNFSKYQMQNIKVLKFSERSTKWLYENRNLNNNKVNEIREELNKRLIKPFLVLLICLISCFLLYSNSEKVNLKKFRPTIYISSVFLIIINQIILGKSGDKVIYSYFYLGAILLLCILTYLVLKKFISLETK